MLWKKLGNFKKERGKSGKSQEILTGFPEVKASRPLNFNSDSSFCQNTISRGDGKFSEVREKSGKM